MASKKKPAAPPPARSAAPASPPVGSAVAGSADGTADGSTPATAPLADLPAAPSSTGTDPVRTTAALAHGSAASGARFVRPGFALTPEADLAFALGFPHLEYIV